ncbi:MAG: hypothetical protein J6R18_01680 [Kiritimatiellae bacterium]|nr:hypothetical protein [Kiritimatiellia bacterium]
MKNTMINKMKNSAFGKLLRRFAGEETGAVMMEYVIVAVLIAAAAVVAIAYFGQTIVGQTNAGAQAITGKGPEAAATVENVRNVAQQGAQEAVDNNKKFSDSKVDAAAK